MEIFYLDPIIQKQSQTKKSFSSYRADKYFKQASVSDQSNVAARKINSTIYKVESFHRTVTILLFTEKFHDYNSCIGFKDILGHCQHLW